MDAIQDRMKKIIERWREQGFVIMPDGSRVDVSLVCGGTMIAGVKRYDARFDTIEPKVIWDVVFTETNKLFLTAEQLEYFVGSDDNVLVVSLQDPTVKKVVNYAGADVAGYQKALDMRDQAFRRTKEYRTAYLEGMDLYGIHGLNTECSPYEKNSCEHKAFLDGMRQALHRDPEYHAALKRDEVNHAQMWEEDRIEAEEEAERQLKKRAETYRRKRDGC